MKQLFCCPKCGYRNYITREDLDKQRAALGDRAAKRLLDKERKDSAWRQFIWRLIDPNKDKL